MNKALEYLKEEYENTKHKIEIDSFEEFVEMPCEYNDIDVRTEIDYDNTLLTYYVLKVDDKLIHCQFSDYVLLESSICFVEEKERVVKYYVPIKD